MAVAETPNTLKQDATLIALVGAAHFCSHFFQLILAPLFPLMHADFGVSYALLGSVLATFYITSGVAQTFSGVFVDRYGARPVLFAGIAMMATGVGLIGFVPSFWMMYPLIVVAGLGNSVFHPADFSLLSQRVSVSRHGRAFSVHAVSGSVGYAAAPLLIGSLAVATDWRLAVMGAGLLGAGLLCLLIRYSDLLRTESASLDTRPCENAGRVSFKEVVRTPVVMFAFLYLVCATAAGGGRRFRRLFSSIIMVCRCRWRRWRCPRTWRRVRSGCC